MLWFLPFVYWEMTNGELSLIFMNRSLNQSGNRTWIWLCADLMQCLFFIFNHISTPSSYLIKNKVWLSASCCFSPLKVGRTCLVSRFSEGRVSVWLSPWLWSQFTSLVYSHFWNRVRRCVYAPGNESGWMFFRINRNYVDICFPFTQPFLSHRVYYLTVLSTVEISTANHTFYQSIY